MRWHYPTIQEWAMIDAYAARYNEQSSRAANTHVWNPQHNLVGLFGEWVYSAETGQPFRPRKVFGDGGYDFPGVDVKASSCWQDPWLKHPAGAPRRAPTFVLVGIDLAGRRGYVAGSAPRDRLAAAPVRDFGNGPMLTLKARDLDAHNVMSSVAA
jgi:hypothetical protein